VQADPNAIISAAVGNFAEGPLGAVAAVQHYVSASVLRTLPRYHIAGGRADIDPPDIAADGLVVCAQTGANVILSGTIESFEDTSDPGMGMDYGTHLVLDVYNCRDLATKPRVFDIHTGNGDRQTSIDIAVNQALQAYAGTLKNH
jgi:hypothetical protein